MGSEDKLQRQKKGPWNLGYKKVKVTHLEGKRRGTRKVEGIFWEGEHSGSSVLSTLKGGDFRGSPRVSIEYSLAFQVSSSFEGCGLH